MRPGLADKIWCCFANVLWLTLINKQDGNGWKGYICRWSTCVGDQAVKLIQTPMDFWRLLSQMPLSLTFLVYFRRSMRMKQSMTFLGLRAPTSSMTMTVSRSRTDFKSLAKCSERRRPTRLITSVPFVRTGRRSYRLSDAVICDSRIAARHGPHGRCSASIRAVRVCLHLP